MGRMSTNPAVMMNGVGGRPQFKMCRALCNMDTRGSSLIDLNPHMSRLRSVLRGGVHPQSVSKPCPATKWHCTNSLVRVQTASNLCSIYQRDI